MKSCKGEIPSAVCLLRGGNSAKCGIVCLEAKRTSCLRPFLTWKNIYIWDCIDYHITSCHDFSERGRFPFHGLNQFLPQAHNYRQRLSQFLALDVPLDLADSVVTHEPESRQILTSPGEVLNGVICLDADQ